MIAGKSVSITTGCHNRLDFLRQSLRTWLATVEPDEIVVVDWGSTKPLHESLEEFAGDPRLVIARVEDQKTWKNAKCHNLELQIAKGELILRLDSDCLIDPSFFASHPMGAGLFYVVRWNELSDMDTTGLAGTLYAWRHDVLAINGYNERLVHYGCEDDDLYARMITSGIKRSDLALSTLRHISHSDRHRLENIELFSTRLRTGTEDEASNAWTKLLSIEKSKEIVIRAPWSVSDRQTSWDIKWHVDTNTKQRRADCAEVVSSPR